MRIPPGRDVDQLEKEADTFAELVEQRLRYTIRRVLGIGEVIIAQGMAESVSPDDLNGIVPVWAAGVDNVLVPAAVAAWVGGSQTQAEIISALTGINVVGFTSESAAAYAYATLARNRLVGIGDELWMHARAQLVEGMQLGETIPQLSARVREAVGLTAPRATVIARTEIVSASNAGSIATMRSTGLVTQKEWIATEDSRTRPNHAAADGQTVDLDAVFSVGGFPLDFPGDPSGPPEEVINCRCTLGYVVPDAEDQIQVSPPEPENISASATLAVNPSSGGGSMETIFDTDVTDETSTSEHHRFSGVAVVEDEWTGDGRRFSPESLTWPDLDQIVVPFQWQKETSHGGVNDVTVTVGRITRAWREGNAVHVEGFIDGGSEDGAEYIRRLENGTAGGVSIVADDPENADVEFVWPEGCDGDFDIDTIEDIDPKCFSPRGVIFHSGRMRALTGVDVPAFVEGSISLVVEEEPMTASTAKEFGAVRSHETPTVDEPWDNSVEVGKLDSPMSVETARNMYAWIDTDAIDDGEIVKAACRFPHHMVSEDGTPGAANLTACSAIIGILNGARGGTNIPRADYQGVYDHAARHLRDADREPPPATFGIVDAIEPLVAATHLISIPDVPPAAWFDEPSEMPAVGAITVTDEGRIYGYLAPRNVGHRGYSKRVTVPMGNVDYARWMNRETIVEGGQRLSAGPITMDCGHASTDSWMGADHAIDHYDNSCSIVATARIGENKNGVWIAGALLADVTPMQVARMLACQLSGDWRPHPERSGMRELCGALLVPVPGFPMASGSFSMRMDEGQLVASAVPVRWAPHGDIEEFATEIESPEPEIITTDELQDQGEEEITLPDPDEVLDSKNTEEEDDLPSWEEVLEKKNTASDENRIKAEELAKELGLM